MPETIQLPVIDTPECEVKQSFKSEFVIWDDCIQILDKSIVWDENEDTGVKEERQVDLDLIHLKKYVVGVSVKWHDRVKKYYVKVGLTGVSDDWNLYFNSKQEAVKVRNRILEWLRK